MDSLPIPPPTELPAVSEELRTQLEFVHQTVGVASWLWNIPSNHTYWFGDIDSVLGLAPGEFAELRQRLISDASGYFYLIHPDEKPSTRQKFVDCLKGLTPRAWSENRIVLPDGRVRWVRTEVQGFYLPDGHAYRVLGLVRDITERKQSEAAVLQSERTLAAVFSATPEALAITRRADGRHIAVNEAWSAFTGHATSEVLGRSALELDLWADPADRTRMLAELESKGRLSNFETRLRRADGTVFDTLLSCVEVQMDGADCLLFAFRDVTALKEAIQRLAESEAKFSKAFYSSPDSVALVRERDGAIIDVNRGYERMSGVSANRVIGRNVFQAGIWRNAEHREVYLQKLRRDGRVHEYPLTVVNAFGEQHELLISAERIELGGEWHVLSVTRDVTEQRKAEALVRELNASLEHRVRERTAALEAANRELESYNYSISHDLRAPLRAISGFAHILRQDYAGRLDGAGLGMLERVEKSAVRLGELIDDLLALSRAGRTELRLEPVDMTALVARALEDLAAAGMDTSVVSVPALPPARADASLLLQVWNNLLSNALKFCRESERPEITVSGRTLADGSTEYCVRDNGCGFDMKYADKLFGMFQRLHPVQNYEGTGIGLALVKRIVERHGGSVRGEGRPGEGATFCYSLPR